MRPWVQSPASLPGGGEEDGWAEENWEKGRERADNTL